MPGMQSNFSLSFFVKYKAFVFLFVCMRCKNSFVAFYAFVLHDNVAYYVPNAVTTESRSAIGLVLQCLRPMKHVASDSFMH